jgi:hypothetical protein
MFNQIILAEHCIPEEEARQIWEDLGGDHERGREHGSQMIIMEGKGKLARVWGTRRWSKYITYESWYCI